MELKDIHKSKTVRGVLIGLGIAILVLVIFRAGMVAGYHRAHFSGQFGDNFSRNFMGPREGGFMKEFSDNHMLPDGHGAVGEIVSLVPPVLVISEKDNIEKTVVVSTSTEVRKFRDTIQLSDLKVGDFVVVLGNPNTNGQIEAKLIRNVPSPR